jgi:oligosaccharide repeat unit polymerase
LIEKFGSITGVLLSGNFVYRLRVANKLSGMIPYLAAFGLPAVCLAGLYCGRIGQIKLLALLPLVAVIVEDIGAAGRAQMLFAGILFFSAYFLARAASDGEKSFHLIGRGKRLLQFVLVLAILLTAAEFVRSYRLTHERFYGMSTELSKLERQTFIITPSIYLYLSSHPGVFNAYLQSDSEHPFPGSNTFAPLFRILSRFGIGEYVPYFQKFYNIPINTNTGTYLRELHADFGLAGILLAPYALGFLCTLVWFRIKRRPRLFSLAFLSHLYVIVGFSFWYQVTRVGHWFVSLLVALVVCGFIDLRCATAATPNENKST